MITDKFGRVHDYLRISLTDKCNFRCTYCMPNEHMKFVPNNQLMTAEEIVILARTFVDLGVKKIRFTGGEPLMRPDAGEIINEIGKLPVKLAITTNGFFVDRYIDLFKEVGLTSINLSLDSLKREKFRLLTQRNFFDQVIDNMNLLLTEGFHVKLNCVVMRDQNVDELKDFVGKTLHEALHVRFIEFMPFRDNRWDRTQVFGLKDMLEELGRHYEFSRIEDAKNDTAKNYQVEGALGTFAVISTVTAPFCDTCNRIRLSATGRIRNCLFGREEIDLLSALRRGEEVKPLILESIQAKNRMLGGLPDFEQESQTYNRGKAMISIGG